MREFPFDPMTIVTHRAGVFTSPRAVSRTLYVKIAS
jgi:hypothetical protein